MRAALAERFGPPEVLKIVELPDPVPGADEVRVDIHAASVNYPDLLHIADKYQGSLPLPFIPGGEFAGIVSAVGKNVDSFSVGDRVRGSHPTGAFADGIVIAPGRLTRLPADADLEQAAAFFVTALTAYQSLVNVAHMKAGEWVVVLGAAGGVGTATVQVAKHLGARVIAAASASKLSACRDAGADAVIDYQQGDLKERIREVSAEGTDVVIDPVGGGYAEQALRTLRWGGRFVTVGYTAGSIPKIPLNLVLIKGISIHGFAMAPFARHHPEEAGRARADVLDLFVSGKVKARVTATFPLERIVDALNLVAQRKAVGKVLIRCR